MNPFLIRILRFAFHCGKNEAQQLVKDYLTSLPDGSVRREDVSYIMKPVLARLK